MKDTLTLEAVHNQFKVFDSLLEGVQVIDYEYRYIYLNESAVKQAKMEKALLLGFTMPHCFPGIEKTPLFDKLTTCLEQQVSGTMLNRFVYPDGDVRYFELRFQLVPQGVLILSIDQTDREKNQQLLKENIERYRIVTNATSDAIWDWDLKKDTVTFGAGYRSIFGYNMEEITHFSTCCLDRVHPEDRQRILDLFVGMMDGGSDKFNVEYRYRKHNDQYVNVIDRGAILRDKKGNAIRIIGAKQDVTGVVYNERQRDLLTTVSRNFGKFSGLNDILDDTLKELLKYTENYRLAEVWLINPTKSVIELAGRSSTFEQAELFYRKTKSIRRFQFGKGMPGSVWKSETELLWQDVANLKAFRRGKFAGIIDLYTVFGLPIFCQNQIIGVLVLGADKRLELSEIYTKFLTGFIEVLGPEIKRKQLELELEHLFAAAPDMICLADFKGYFKKVNPNMCELTGYTEEELMAVPFSHFIHPDDKHVLYQQMVKQQYGHKTLSFESRCFAKDGRILWLSWSARPSVNDGLIYAIAKDITEKKELEQLLGTVNQMAQIGGWEVDLLQDKVFWTEITRQILEEERSVERSLMDGINYCTDAEDRLYLKQLIGRSVEFGEPFDVEIQINTAKGHSRWVRIMGEVEMRNALPVRLFGCIQDITDRREIVLRMQQMNADLELRTKKLQVSNRELEQFAYVASHDLQEPLRMVTSFLTQLEKKYKDQLDDKAKQYIYFAVDGAKRMRQIILDLLDFSRVGRENEPVKLIDLNQVVSDILILYRKWIEELNAEIIVDPLPHIYSIASPLRQVFQNLISNSLKYRLPEVRPLISISAKEMETEWEFTVSDNGMGIEPQYQERIFQLFQRLHKREEYSGTGIGLALVKKIIEQLNGRIWIDSVLGKGTSFYFVIPKISGVQG